MPPQVKQETSGFETSFFSLSSCTGNGSHQILAKENQHKQFVFISFFPYS